MKKIGSLIFAVVMIVFGAVAAFPVSAADSTAAVNGVEPVVHYDFSGDTIDEALKDKAKGGTTSDDLKAYVGKSCKTNLPYDYLLEDTLAPAGFADFNSKIIWDKSNGTIKAGAGANLQAASSAETRSILSENGSAMVVRFKFDSVGSNYTIATISQDNADKLLSVHFEAIVNNASTGQYVIRMIILNDSLKRLYTEKLFFFVPNTSAWYSMTVNLKEVITDSSTGAANLTYSAHLTSVGDFTYKGFAEKTVTTYHNTVIHEGNKTTEAAPLSLFDTPCNGGNRGIVLDDFRIYNTTITAANDAKKLNFSSVVSGDVTLPTKTVFWQSAPNGDGTYDVRCNAVIDELAFSADTVGFEVQAAYADKVSYVKTYTTNVLYESINANNKGTIERVSADTYGGKYIISLALTGIKDSYGDVTFIIKPFAVNGNEKVYKNIHTFTVNAGNEVIA